MAIAEHAPRIPYPTLTATAALALVREVAPAGARPPRLLDRVREGLRTRHYSRRTEKAYVHWIKRYIFFHDKRHPAEISPGSRHFGAPCTGIYSLPRGATGTRLATLRHCAECWKRGNICIVELNNECVGMIQLHEFPDRLEVGEIQIQPSHRNQGIGSRLLQDVLARAHAQRKKVSLSTGLKNHRAVRLYERLGFSMYPRARRTFIWSRRRRLKGINRDAVRSA